MANEKPAFFVKTNPEHRVPELWNRHVEFLQGKIRRQEFDLILLDNWLHFPDLMQNLGAENGTDSGNDSRIDNEKNSEALLNTYYTQTAKFTLPLVKRRGGGSFKVQIWKPKMGIPENDKPPSR